MKKCNCTYCSNEILETEYNQFSNLCSVCYKRSSFGYYLEKSNILKKDYILLRVLPLLATILFVLYHRELIVAILLFPFIFIADFSYAFIKSLPFKKQLKLNLETIKKKS